MYCSRKRRLVELEELSRDDGQHAALDCALHARESLRVEHNKRRGEGSTRRVGSLGGV